MLAIIVNKCITMLPQLQLHLKQLSSWESNGRELSLEHAKSCLSQNIHCSQYEQPTKTGKNILMTQM